MNLTQILRSLRGGPPNLQNLHREAQAAASASSPDYAREAQAALSGAKPNYVLYHACIAAAHMKIAGKKGLVIGCNRGYDCKLFIDFGADSVVGLDVIDEIGINFAHDRVAYVRESAECMPFDDGSFDFVFCFATMEHVPNIERAYCEMVRVLRPGAVVYCVASPLWCARQGPHWGTLFDDDFPWIHLRRSREEILDYCAKRRLEAPNGMLSEARISYLLDPGNINQRRAHEYVTACAVLDDVALIRNDIEFEDPGKVDRGAVRECVARGYNAFDLFGLTHTLIARRT